MIEIDKGLQEKNRRLNEFADRVLNDEKISLIKEMFSRGDLGWSRSSEIIVRVKFMRQMADNVRLMADFAFFVGEFNLDQTEVMRALSDAVSTKLEERGLYKEFMEISEKRYFEAQVADLRVRLEALQGRAKENDTQHILQDALSSGKVDLK